MAVFSYATEHVSFANWNVKNVGGIMGSFKDGKVLNTYSKKDGGYIKVANDADLNENWFNAIQTEVRVFK